MNANSPGEDSELAFAVGVIGNGGIVGHACEGVWGLACDPWNESAVSRILSIKSRSDTKGLILIGHDAKIFDAELEKLELAKQKIVKRSWPGHTTWIVPSTRFPNIVTGNRSTIAIRVPGHVQARELCSRTGIPLVSTSANVSNRPPARSMLHVEQTLGSMVDFVLPGAIGNATGPSEIRDALSGERIR
jgi:L-threonylcarbamoyladenylate synthase